MGIGKNLLLVSALLLASRSAAAQAVRGELLEGASGRPVAGALVVLLDGAGKQVGGGFTDAAGEFLVQAPGPGSYTLRAERVGFAAVRSPALRLAAGQTVTHDLETGSEAVKLEGLVVRAEKRRCAALPEAGEATAALWEEARKALGAAALTQARRSFRFTVQQHVRMLDASSLQVESEQSRRMTGFAGSPFESAPAERLVREGFTRQEGDSTVYYGPDAAVLLSDEFLDTHCFRVQESEGAARGLVGLAFEPVRGRRLPDIRGALWLDPATAELRHLEYTYTGLDLLGPSGRLGGRVEFERLPSGEWIVPRWRILMPVVGTDTLSVAGQVRERRKVAAIREGAGEVLEVRTPAGVLVRSAARASLSGVVFDSTRSAPLAGARVRLAGTAVEAETDAGGRFRIPDAAEGRYRVVVDHPRVDSLEWTAPALTVDLRRDAETEVRLAVPPLASVLAARCPPLERRGGTGVVVGVVKQAGAAAPPPATPVVLSWAADGTVPAGRTVAWTDALGNYHACAVPFGVAVEARVGSPSAPAAELRASAERATRHDLVLAAPPAAVAAAPRVLEPLVVTAAPPLARRTRSSGVRMDVLVREEVERLRGIALHAGDLVRRFPGVGIQENMVRGVVVGVCVRQTRKREGSPCAAVFVDGVFQPNGAEELARLNLSRIESIEFVPPVLARSRYGREAEGGALLVYTIGNGPYAARPGS
jgi:hypothetical protein